MIKRNFMMAALILCMVTNASVPIYASGGPGVVIQETIESYAQRRNPEQLSAEQIMTELYANVNNPMIQDGAKTEAMLLTGENRLLPISTESGSENTIFLPGRAQLLLLAIPLSHFHWFIRTKTVPRNMLSMLRSAQFRIHRKCRKTGQL